MSLAKGSPIQYDDVNVLRNEGVLSTEGISGPFFAGKRLSLGDTLSTSTVTNSDGSIMYISSTTNTWHEFPDSEGNLVFEYVSGGQANLRVGTINKSS